MQNPVLYILHISHDSSLRHGGQAVWKQQISTSTVVSLYTYCQMQCYHRLCPVKLNCGAPQPSLFCMDRSIQKTSLTLIRHPTFIYFCWVFVCA